MTWFWRKEKYQHLKSAFFSCWLNFSEILIHWINWFWRKFWPSVRVDAEEPRWSDANGILDLVWVLPDVRDQREGVYLYHLDILMEYIWASHCLAWDHEEVADVTKCFLKRSGSLHGVQFVCCVCMCLFVLFS